MGFAVGESPIVLVGADLSGDRNTNLASTNEDDGIVTFAQFVARRGVAVTGFAQLA